MLSERPCHLLGLGLGALGALPLKVSCVKRTSVTVLLRCQCHSVNAVLHIIIQQQHKKRG